VEDIEIKKKDGTILYEILNPKSRNINQKQQKMKSKKVSLI
jgi:hypothetical protein